VKASRRKGRIKVKWQEFLAATNGSLKIGFHCREQFKKRFPDMEKLTDAELIALARQAKPLCTYEYLAKDMSGWLVRTDNIVFAINIENKKIMTVYPCSKRTPKKISLNRKRGCGTEKTAYSRPAAKREARKRILEEFSA